MHSQEGSDSYKLHLQWEGPMGVLTERLHSYTIMIWYLLMDLTFTAYEKMY